MADDNRVVLEAPPYPTDFATRHGNHYSSYVDQRDGQTKIRVRTHDVGEILSSGLGFRHLRQPSPPPPPPVGYTTPEPQPVEEDADEQH